MPGQGGASGGQQVAAGAGGDVIEDQRPVRGVGDGGVVGDETGLGGFVVVGGHQQTGVGAYGAGVTGHGDGLGGAVAAGTGDDRHPARRPLHSKADDRPVLLLGHGGALGGGAASHQAGYSRGDLPVDETAVGLVVNGAAGVHGGGQGGGDTAKDLLFHGVSPFFVSEVVTGRTKRARRSMASCKVSMEQQQDIRTKPSFPKTVPGTAATPAS